MPKETIFRISRAVDLHSVALETNEIDNKLLSLWTAIETLIQKDVSSGKDRIIQIIDGITPFESNNYFNRILSQIKSDFWHYDEKLSKDIFNRIKIDKKESLLNNIAALICTKENKENREYAYSKIKDFPLLRWRMFMLSKTFGNGKNALSLINTHNQKVKWQIRRMYRVRNLIVHSGFRPSYTNILVENFHDYFDSLMNSFIDSAISEKKIKRISHGILEYTMRTELYLVLLEKYKDSETNLSNYKQSIFGSKST